MEINEFKEIFRKIESIERENSALKSEVKNWKQSYLDAKNAEKRFNDERGVYLEQIRFMSCILQGIFKECTECKGEGGFGIDMGEQGWNYDRCVSCLGSGITLISKIQNEEEAND